MTARCFVDTNILIYSQDLDVPQKYRAARNWIDRLTRANALVLSAQSVLEYYAAARRRFAREPRADLRQFARKLVPLCRAPSGVAVLAKAWDIEDRTDYYWFDCLLIASACASGCRYFVSEDLQHGRKIDDLTIIDPFRVELDAILTGN
jgi:predicted nucleic acid-binding protein